MPIELGNFSLGTVVGGVVVGCISHLLTNSRNKTERLVAARKAFKDSFTPALCIFEKREVSYEEVEQFTSYFDTQLDAMISFKGNLIGKRRRLFEQKWSRYVEWQKKYKNHDEGAQMVAIATQSGRDFNRIVNDLFAVTEMSIVSIYLQKMYKQEI